MISRELEFHRPGVLQDALSLLAERGDETTVLSGGMSLVPMMNLGLAEPTIVLSLNHVPELDYVRFEGKDLAIGARVRHARIATDPLVQEHCPVLAAAARFIGDVQVRNRGTIGGSIAHADPSADYIPVLTVLGAQVRLRSAVSERTVRVQDFVVDFMQTAREPSELVVEVVVPSVQAGWGTAYQRLARVEGSFAIVNAAVMVAPDGASGSVALGGVGTTPLLVDVSAHLHGATASDLDAVGDAAYEASSAVSGDAVSGSEFRREMARTFARRVVAEALSRAGNGNRAGG